MTTLPPALARVLAEHRATVVPVVGAGLALAANVPGTREVAQALHRHGAANGLVNDEDAGFVESCGVFEAHFGLETLQDVTAETVLTREPEPDPALRALVRCPSRIVLTTNYDFSAEEAVRATRREAFSFGLDQAAAWTPPPEGAVHVVHLHGQATEPRSMVFPGASTEALETDERFKTLLRAVVAPRTVLYLGFAFGATETHLRAELDWLVRSFTDAGEHHVLLPAGESSDRGAELEQLLAKPKVEAHFYDEQAQGHTPVLHAALVLSPQSPARAESVQQRALASDEYFLAPPLLPSEPDEDRTQLDTRMVSAEFGLGTHRYVLPDELVALGRVMLDAPPGMGKTQALLVAGERARDWQALYLRLPTVAAHVGPGGADPLTGALRALRDAQAFDDHTPRPTTENLDSGAYALLLDGFDEVEPERRADVLAAVEALVDRFPQHAYVLATRPTVDAAPLYDQGFVRHVLVPSAAWGGRYMEHRSVPADAVAQLYDRLPTARELVAVPVYASAIAERLVRGEEVPGTPLPLLVAVQRDAILDDAEYFTTGTEELFAYLQRLAVALQLRGLTEAPTQQLAELTGKGMPDAEALRREMIERALLQDREGIVAFPLRVMQEALCADAMLATDDPVRTVREVAAAELGGELMMRGDMDHVLDLMWESAMPDIRGRLRDLDELRWARTQSPVDSEAAQEALDIIWAWFERRRLWLTDDYDSRQTRGAQTAVERLLRADADGAEARRDALIEASSAPAHTTRGNALSWLTYLPATDDADAPDWLITRISDDNSVVRRHACVAAEQLQVRAAYPAIQEQLSRETDEGALEALGHTALVLAEADDLPHLAANLLRRPRAWRRVSDEVIERVQLATLLELLAEPQSDAEAWDDLLDAALQRQPVDAWSADEVQALSRALILHARQGDILSHLEQLGGLAISHPEAAVRGAEEGAQGPNGTEGLLTIDFVFLQGLPRDILVAAFAGPLGELVAPLLPAATADAEGAADEPTATGAAEPSQTQPRRRPRRLVTTGDEPSDPDHMPLADALERGLYARERPPHDRQRWLVDSLSQPQRTHLTELVESWWPQPPLTELIQLTDDGWNVDTSALSIVLAASALDLPLTPERWNDALASGALTWPGGGVAEWLQRRYVPECLPAALNVIGSVRNAEQLLSVAQALGGNIGDEAARALVTQWHRAKGPYLLELAAILAEEGHLVLIRQGLAAAADPGRQRPLQRVLARHGDTDAQLALVEAVVVDMREGRPVDESLLDWHAAARDERLVEPLAELLGGLPDAPAPFHGPQRAVRAALAATRSQHALAMYDQLADDPDRPERAFQWYPRAELAGDLATEKVLGELPETPAGTFERLRQLGFDR